MDDRLGRYWMIRRGTWLEMVMVEARDPKHAQEIATTIPDEVWAASRVLTEPKRRQPGYAMGGVSLGDDRLPWNAAPTDEPVTDAEFHAQVGEVVDAHLDRLREAEAIRVAKEDAWDEGRDSLASDMRIPLNQDGMRPASKNPYRKAF